MMEAKQQEKVREWNKSDEFTAGKVLSSVPLFEVIEPGLHTTVQDLGRYGFQKHGIGPSGVMDDYSFRIGNILVGNEDGAAGLEVTMVGPSLRVLRETVICITGAHLSPTVDQVPAPMWTSLHVKEGQVIRFGKPQIGARAYLTVAGGFQVAEVMGSLSTNVKSKFGGMHGRTLSEQDILPGEAIGLGAIRKRRGRRLASDSIPKFLEQDNIRVLAGPQEGMFTPKAIRDFYMASFKISSQSDRMGYRLMGDIRLPLKESVEMITDAVVNGSIQVPGSGEPILLMADRQTSGGYPKIANVITVDLYKVAQRLPGEKICFEKVTLEEAHAELRKRERFLKLLRLGAGLN